jgi:hypothetical protein
MNEHLLGLSMAVWSVYPRWQAAQQCSTMTSGHTRTWTTLSHSLLEDTIAQQWHGSHWWNSDLRRNSNPDSHSCKNGLCDVACRATLVCQCTPKRTYFQPYQHHQVIEVYLFRRCRRIAFPTDVCLVTNISLVSRLHNQHKWLLLLLMSMGWDYVSKLQPPTGLLFSPRWYMSMDNRGRMISTGENSWLVHQSSLEILPAVT